MLYVPYCALSLSLPCPVSFFPFLFHIDFFLTLLSCMSPNYLPACLSIPRPPPLTTPPPLLCPAVEDKAPDTTTATPIVAIVATISATATTTRTGTGMPSKVRVGTRPQEWPSTLPALETVGFALCARVCARMWCAHCIRPCCIALYRALLHCQEEEEQRSKRRCEWVKHSLFLCFLPTFLRCCCCGW